MMAIYADRTAAGDFVATVAELSSVRSTDPGGSPGCWPVGSAETPSRPLVS